MERRALPLLVVLRAAWPSAPSLLLLLLGIMVLWFGSLLWVIIELDTKPGAWSLASIGAVIAALVVPPACVLTCVASILNTRPLPRAWLLVVNGIGLSMAALLFGVSFAVEEGVSSGITCGTVLYGPWVVLVGLAGLVHIPWAWAQVRRELADARRDWLVGDLAVRPRVPLAEVGERTWLGDKARAWVEGLIASGDLDGVIEADGAVYATAGRDALLVRLLAVIQARGSSSLDELAAELHTTRAVIRTWLHEASERHGFAGFVGDDGRVRAQEVEAGACPSCAGALDLAGHGIVRCVHCGSEVYR